jgi:hypothetical protein
MTLTTFLLLLAPAAAPPPRLAPDLRPLVKQPANEMADVIRRYEADRDSLQRTYPILSSPGRHARMERFYAGWVAALEKLAADKLGKAAQADLAGLKQTVGRDREEVVEQAKLQAELAPLLPFAPGLIALEESRRRMEPVDPVKAAAQLTEMTKEIAKLQKTVKASPADARQAAVPLGRLRGHFRHWFDFYNGYDPLFSWWMAEPYKSADEALQRYAASLRERGKEPDARAREEKKPSLTLRAPTGESDAPDLAAILAAPRREMEPVIRRFQDDRFRRGRLAGAGLAPPTPRSARANAE